MFKNYFKTAFRSLTRNRNYTIINIAGLAVGIAVCMMIFIIIQFQTSFDNFHSKKDRIYRVLTEYHHADAANIAYGKDVPFPMPAGLKTAFPQIEQVAPIYASHNDQLLVPDDNGTPVKNFKEQSGVFYTAPSFFKIFDFPLLAGSYASLKDPNNVLLTKEIAETYFGDWKTAIGKTIKLTDICMACRIIFSSRHDSIESFRHSRNHTGKYRLSAKICGCFWNRFYRRLNIWITKSPIGRIEQHLILVAIFCCRRIFLLTILISN